jgi:hypothetical protein
MLRLVQNFMAILVALYKGHRSRRSVITPAPQARFFGFPPRDCGMGRGISTRNHTPRSASMTVLILITSEAIRIVTLPDMATCIFMASQVAHMGLVACGAAGVQT